ncbi:MAG: Gfo/Idh/MocA family oxidoreductase [Candidatus Latescibacteria bacterium]|nr:Gfo/Idh/MocA family oxidoreductase [Candidatus Latescibacterota bacterium]
MHRRRIRVGVIGLGFGLQHVRGFQGCQDVEILAICSQSQRKVTAAAKELGIAYAFTDYREMLELDDLDGVSICSPVYLHHQMALDAIAAGKHVLCEKPLALNPAQAREMYERAEQAGVVHMTNFGWRFNPPAFRLKTLLDEGYIGHLYHINARYLMGYRADPAIPFGWRDQQAAGGFGALGDLAVHLIDMMRWWAGEFVRVAASMKTLVADRPIPGSSKVRPSELDDTCAFLAELGEGIQGVFHASRCAIRSNYIHIDLHGNDGTLVFQFQRETMQVNLLGARGLHEELHDIPMPKRLRVPTSQQQFVEGIRSRKPVQPSFYEGLRVQYVADAIVRSAKQGRWVSVEE